MNVGIDARLLHSTTGIGRYTRSLVFEYTQREYFQNDRLVLFSDAPVPPEQQIISDNVEVVISCCQHRILWTNWYLPPLLQRHKIDVYHGVCNFELPIRKVCRYVVTIHDLVPLFFPELVPQKHLLFFRLFMKRVAHTADLIITDSEHSKKDIIQFLKVPEKKIRVIYLGYQQQYHRIQEQQRISEVLARYRIRQPYLLFVGVIEPKKNLERLVEAYSLLQKNAAISKEMQLVIAGGEGWFSERLYRKVKDCKLEQQIVFPGYIPDECLPTLYSGAELFVFPSIYEGFGLPVLEAMSYRVPVVTSNVSSLPEIAGEAGVLIDPHQPDAIARGILKVLSDRQLQEQMREKGYRQAQRFSWERTAQETYQVYREIYENRN
ncbi:mannosyltransferase B [Candidatus Vecturithrix granuli]|uniref:Mannosyltransferase B n=1 Tax=Vecturithrix granuli TaxID=1499967 RepID=A0A081BVI0_VECG1|nr:mannosyltransferase B [Candidatus Vecturithrix granuli]